MNYHISFDLDFRRNPYPGKFIVIEGIDGSGKTTQAKLLVDRLKVLGKEAVYTKEPTDGPIGQFIRQTLRGAVDVSPLSIQYLLAADRVLHAEEVEKYLKEGKTLIGDRYFWSAVAYGMADRQETQYEDNGYVLLLAQGILSMYTQFIVPDITFYLRTSVDIALSRLAKMTKEKELYETREKLEKIYQGYEWLASQFPEEITVVDGEKEMEEVTEGILWYLGRRNFYN